MSKYKEMYLKMFSATEEAINILLQAQREAEEIYISSPECYTESCPEEKDFENDK